MGNPQTFRYLVQVDSIISTNSPTIPRIPLVFTDLGWLDFSFVLTFPVFSSLDDLMNSSQRNFQIYVYAAAGPQNCAMYTIGSR